MADNTFDAQLRDFNAKLARRVHDVFVRSTEEVQESIVEGSPLTGAPGQPVDTSALKGSWHHKRHEKFLWATETPLKYAPVVEEGGLVMASGRSGALSGSRYTLRSEVGGFHSVKLTAAAWQKIVDHAVREVAR
jgi:hypothetical protein